MNVFSMRTIRAFGAVALICASVTAVSAQTATSRIVSAANNFISTLDDQQRKSVLYAFDDAKQRTNWSNLPVRMVPRGGVSMKDLNAAQRTAAMALVSSALSKRGFEKVEQIMDGDEALKTSSNNNPM